MEREQFLRTIQSRTARVAVGQETRFGNKVWLISVHQLAEHSFSKEQPFVERAEKKASFLVADKDAAISWIRWTGKARFRAQAQRGDIIIQIWKSLSGKRIKVFAPCPIVHRQDVAHWTRFYVAEFEDTESLSWERFRKEARRVGYCVFPRTASGNSTLERCY